MQRFFRTTPPTVHSMIKTLERHGFIRRQPGSLARFNSSYLLSNYPSLNRSNDLQPVLG